jgi:hypothetical protein
MCAILFLGGFGMFEVSGTVRLRSSSFGETAFALRAEHMWHHRREGWLAKPKPERREGWQAAKNSNSRSPRYKRGYESFHHMSSRHTNVGIICGMQA